ncbi:probable transmembrane ascorbate ferrireductase 3 [Eucalyptus grandis]|uniref:probable transmembrane ascorbate ferrireductase 3 n=1 Tax=Eucalyptus grandis TaxID=71139 RepID=UPI00192E7B87|nr:probable transmembrane ascorbate ferrireductase 3 [Eucalyptus grandis]
MITGRHEHYGSASRLTVAAHLCGVLSIVLMLVWLLHYREGMEFDSDNALRVFNVHPFLMVFGFIFFSGEAMMAYKTVAAEWQVRKVTHMFLHIIAFILGVVGLCAVFKFHNMQEIEDMNSLHSWIGIGTISLFGCQWLLGLFTFMIGATSREARSRMAPWHITGGRIILFMAVCTALTGLMQKAVFLELKHEREARLVNFIAVFILLFGIFVDASVSLAHYV